MRAKVADFSVPRHREYSRDAFDKISAMKESHVVLSTVTLNWNRAELLRRTLHSYAETVSVSHEMFVIDNGSTDESPQIIRDFCRERENFHAILLSENRGGEALNLGLERARGTFLHISENDLEYLPNWDEKLLAKFAAFPKLGQLSLFSPFHEKSRGEVWDDKIATASTRDGQTIYLTHTNVGSASVLRREVWEAGVRWRNYEVGNFKFPDDGRFSRDVRSAGFDVAWNDEYVVVNWGHNIEEMQRELPYYLENYAAKDWFGIKSWRERLEDHGYRLVQSGESYSVEKLPDSPRHRVWYGARKVLRSIRKAPRVLALRLRPKSRLRAWWKQLQK